MIYIITEVLTVIKKQQSHCGAGKINHIRRHHHKRKHRVHQGVMVNPLRHNKEEV